MQLGGIKEGDFIVDVDGIDVKWYTNEQIGSLIVSCGSCLDLKVITPMDRNYLKVYTKLPIIHNVQNLTLCVSCIVCQVDSRQ